MANLLDWFNKAGANAGKALDRVVPGDQSGSWRVQEERERKRQQMQPQRPPQPRQRNFLQEFGDFAEKMNNATYGTARDFTATLPQQAREFEQGTGQAVDGAIHAIPRALKSYGLDARNKEGWRPRGIIERGIYGDEMVTNSRGVGQGTMDAVGGIFGHDQWGTQQTPTVQRAVGSLINAFDVMPIGFAGKAATEAAYKASAPVVGRAADNFYGAIDNNSPEIVLQKETGLGRADVLNDNEANTLTDFGQTLLDRDPIKTGAVKNLDEYNVLVKRARHAAQNAGVDIISGNPAQIRDRIIDYIERRDAWVNGAQTYDKAGGFLGGESAVGFKDAQAQGRVFDGVDGKKRFEVSDKDAKVDKSKIGYQTPLKDILDHPKLYEEYPHLKDVKVTKDASSTGSYDFDTKEIRIGAYAKNPKKQILHEIQHAIQDKENFARGGNLDNGWDEYQRYAGEAESRAVENRMSLADSKRYVPETPPSRPAPKNPNTTMARAAEIARRMAEENEASYRSAHQITDGVAIHKANIDEVVNQIKGKYGLSNYDQTDIRKLKKIASDPEADVKIYRAAPVNELNSGDWVTTSKTYANDIKRQNGGKVYEHTVKAKELHLPKNIEDNPSLARFSAFQFAKESTAPQPKLRSTFYDSLDVPKDELIVKGAEKVKAENRLYHGTTEKWDGEPRFPLYTTPKKEYADVFARSSSASSIGKSTVKANDANGTIYEFELNPKARVLDATDPKVKQMLDDEYFGKWSMSDKFYPGQNGHLDWTEGENLAEWIEENNLPYDAIKLDEGGGGVDPQFGGKVIDKGVSIMALNKDAIKNIDSPVAMSIDDARAYAAETNSTKKTEYKPSKRVKQAEKDYATGKITGDRLEAIREADASGMPVTKQVTPARNLDSEEYVKEQIKAQKDAEKTSSTNFKEKTSDFKEKFIDDLSPIEDRLNKAIKSGAVIDPKDHITYQLDRSRRAEGIMNAYVKDNGLDKVIQNVADPKEFDQYLIARHAKELDESIITGRDAAKDAALVKQLDAKYGEQAKELYKYNQKLLDSSVEYGLISKEMAKNLKKKYPEYVPFNRIFNEDELAAISGGAGKGNASIASQGVVKKIKGSERAISSPLNSIIDKTRLVVEQGERNKAAKLLASYRHLDSNPFNLRELKPDETIGSKHTVSYLDNGKKRTFETDKDIADAAKNMTREEIGMWGRIAAAPARVLRGGATTVNVGFAGANVVKDVVGAAINSKHPFRIADPEAFGKALAAALNHNGKHYQELMREGVSGTSFDMFRNPLKSNVAEIRSRKNVGTRAAYTAAHPGQWYRGLENTIGRSEDFGRALQYYSNKKGFKAEGKTDDVAKLLAGDQARNNSTNFFRHGSVGKNVNLAIPYWNAGVQGSRITVNRIKQRPAQTVAKIGMAIAAPSAMIAMNNYADEEKRAIIEDIPDYEKDGNIIIVGPNARYNEETNKYDGVFKIPVPPQHIGVHKTIQDTVRSAMTGEKFKAADNFGRIMGDLTTINPTDLKEIANRYTPQALKLVAEPMTNTNFFTENKIVPDSQKNLPAADQYGDYTSGTAKTIGKLTNTSPRMIDNTFRTAMGGAGQNLIKGTDSLLASVGAIDKDEVKGRSVADSVTGRFYGANAINPSDKADKKLAKLKEEVISSDAYKNASQYDKSRMLNRLETDVNAVEWDKSGRSTSDKKLTKKQQDLADNGFNAETYTNLEAKPKKNSLDDLPAGMNGYDVETLERFNGKTAKEKQQILVKEKDAEYKLELAEYERDKKNGILTQAEEIRRTSKLEKLKVGKDFDKTTRDLYSLSKAQVYNLVTKPGGDKLAQQLLAYGDAMEAAGLANNKFRLKNGSVSFGDARRTGRSGGRSRTGRTGRAGSRSSRPGVFRAPVGGSSSLSSAISTSSALYKLVSGAKVERKKVA